MTCTIYILAPENGLHVQELAVRSEGLEAYFTALVGGDSHADAG